jgi:hypothetical protein
MKTAITSLVCLTLAAAAGCVQDSEEPITVVDHDARTQTATVLVDSIEFQLDVSDLPPPDPTEPPQPLRCWWGDFSECGWAWQPSSGGTVCCGY